MSMQIEIFGVLLLLTGACGNSKDEEYRFDVNVPSPAPATAIESHRIYGNCIINGLGVINPGYRNYENLVYVAATALPSAEAGTAGSEHSGRGAAVHL